MKYLEISIEQARQCCKRHMRKCEKCPLRVERETINPYTKKTEKFLQFCRFILADMEENIETKLEILDMEIAHEEEWKKYIEAVESEP